MTTIAWDGISLAADKLACYGNTRRTVRKLFDCGAYFYGASGDWSEAHVMAEWLRAGAPAAARPTFNEEAVLGIVIRKSDRKAFVAEGRRVALTEIAEPAFATGSGRDFARAAMSLGCDAQHAVELASAFDVSSSGGVDVIRLVPPKIPSRKRAK